MASINFTGYPVLRDTLIPVTATPTSTRAQPSRHGRPVAAESAVAHGRVVEDGAGEGAAGRAVANGPYESVPLPIDIRNDVLPPRLRPDRDFGVLDVTEWFGDTSGGVRRYLLEKARYVADHEALSQVMVVPGADTTVSDSDGTRCYRLRGPIIPTQAPYRVMHDGRAIERIAGHERPDLIELGSPWIAPWIAHRIARDHGIPLVWFFHGNFPRAFATRPNASRPARVMRTAGARLAWRYVRRVSRLVTLTLVSSESTAVDLRHAGVDPVVRVPLGVDLEMFHPRRRTRADEVRRTLGLPERPRPVVGFMGRFVAEKELEVLIDAWPEIERRTDAILLMVGAGPMERTLRRRAEQVGVQRIIWRPFEHDRERMATLLGAVDLYVAPGSTETFGLAPLEALACGTAVLSADEGGVAEQVSRSGAGAVFRASDPADLARVAVALLDSDLGALGARGRSYATREHSWSAVFDRLFRIYREVAQGAGAAEIVEATAS